MRWLSFLLLAACTWAAGAHDAFELAGQHVAPGTVASFLAQAGGTDIPLSVLHGSRAGPVLTLTAGIHGDEYPGIFALQRLRATLDPTRLSGSVILVHLANPDGFHARRIALNPRDGKNLNRVFPGHPDGTPSEQIAHFLTTTVIQATDYLIDLHAGSANQALWPHVYAPVLDDPALDQRTLDFARATGLRHIVLYGERPRDPARSISYPNTAQTRGKPGLTVEIGHLGERDEAAIARVHEVCLNALRHLGMIEGVAPDNLGHVLYRELHAVASPAAGMFTATTTVGELVDRDALLGVVTDYFGAPLAEIRAPVRGVVFMLDRMPPVLRGETPVTIAALPPPDAAVSPRR